MRTSILSKSLLLSIILTSVSAMANVPTQLRAASSTGLRFGKMVQVFTDHGIEFSDSQFRALEATATAASAYERSANQYSSLANPTIGNRVLICVKGKAGGFVIKGEAGICADLGGLAYFVVGDGLGLAAGVAADIVTMVYIGRYEGPIIGTYNGLTASSSLSKSAALATQMAKLINGLPKIVGPDFGVYQGGADRGVLVMLGLQIGPMIDVSATRLHLSYL